MQELLRLPSVNEDVVAGFEAAMMATRSDKDQRNLIKRLLFNSGKYLINQKGCEIRESGFTLDLKNDIGKSHC